jgi:hypothetical protein
MPGTTADDHIEFEEWGMVWISSVSDISALLEGKRRWRDVLDQTRMVPSSPVLIAPLPSGNATTEYTKDEWPDRDVFGSALSNE